MLLVTVFRLGFSQSTVVNIVKKSNMWSAFGRSLVRGTEGTLAIMKDTKRHAGHSKWANIKHTKAVKDRERAVMFAKLVRQMNVAIIGKYSSEYNQYWRLLT